MKKTIAIFALSFIGVLTTFANGDEKYTKAMQAALSQMHTAAKPEQMQAVANRFEMIGKSTSSEWLPNYYAAFCYANRHAASRRRRKNEPFGGGTKNACPLLQRAKEKFNTFKPASELAPAWGVRDLEQHLAQCK